MLAGRYPFIDIVVLDAVRERFARGEALLVLSQDAARLVWLNGAGAALLGFQGIEEALGGEREPPVTAMRQFGWLAGLAAGQRRKLAVRLATGSTSHLVGLEAEALPLPDGKTGILLSAGGEAPADEQRQRASAILGIGDETTHVALVDAQGTVLAASPDFNQAKIGGHPLDELMRPVLSGPLRQAKRRIETPAGTIAAGIARLTDDPALYLLFVGSRERGDRPAAGGAANPPRDDGFPAEGRRERRQKSESGGAGAPEEAPFAVRPSDAAGGIDRWYFHGDAGGGRLISTPADNVAGHSGQVTQPAPGRQAPAPDAGPGNLPPADRGERAAKPMRFIWRTDAAGRFTEISPEFAAAVGAHAADVLGQSFAEVAEALSLDPDQAVVPLFERRETWSGRTLLWPMDGSSRRVPVELSALPAYSRDRTFVGFRGFGVVRTGEAIGDPGMRELPLHTETAGPNDTATAGEDHQPAERPPAAEDGTPAQGQGRDGARDGAREDGSDDPFRGEPPVIYLATNTRRRSSDKVIELGARRRPGELSASERTAFHEIAERLRREGLAGMAHAGSRHGGEDVPANAEKSVPGAAGGTGTVGKPDAPLSAPAAEADQAEPRKLAEAPSPPAAGWLPSAFATGTRSRAKNGVDTSVLASLPVPVVVHGGDEIHYVNRAFLDLTGYESAGDLARAGGLDGLLTAEKDAGSGGALTLWRRDGSKSRVRAHLQSVPWEGGRALMLTVLPQPEDSPERTARINELTAILDTATDGVVILGSGGDIRSLNHSAAALFGYEPSEVIGKPFSMLFAIESQRAAMDYLNGLSGSGVASLLNDGREVIGREAQGGFIPLFMTMGRLAPSNGYCVVLRDITQWKRTEEELVNARREAERSSNQKSEFLARISHEIRTPLNAIIGFAELMSDEKFGPIGNQRYRDYLRDISRSGNHVLDIVNDLLDLTKIEAGGLDLKFEAVPLNDALSEAVAIMQPQANRERVIIRSSLHSGLPDIVADLRSIKQIALNLLSNAVRFTGPGGQVIVSTGYEPSGEVVMRVRDTGIGMSKAEIDEALKPFRQINTLRRTRGDGTGLGLPLTKAMVEANRASFSIQSTPGRGTMIEITFPPTRVLAV